MLALKTVASDHASALPRAVRESAARWAAAWGTRGLDTRTNVVFSPRLRRSLARCFPERRLVRLAERLREATPTLLEEVLCHELAHIAVFELHGRNCRPHGTEWSALVRAAGFKPRARLTASDASASGQSRVATRWVYRHRCPVCQAERIGRRPVHRWRCASCVTSGLEGRLVITRRRANGHATP